MSPIDKAGHLMLQPLSFYTSLEKKPLLVHFIACGQGNTILVVFPNSTTWLFDCNAVETGGHKKRILNYLAKHIPHREPGNDFPDTTQWIDVFVNTHRDQDHFHGLRDINAEFPIRRIIESGVTGAGTGGKEYQYFMRLRRELRKKFGDSAVFVPYTGWKCDCAGVELICLNAEAQEQQAAIALSEALRKYDLSAFPDESPLVILKEAKKQHYNALVFMLLYAGRTILLTSDSDYTSWRDKIVPFVESRYGTVDYLKSNLLLASHHGSREFFTSTNNPTIPTIDPDEYPDHTFIDHLEAIAPTTTVVSCGKPDKNNLPNEDAMNYYREHTDPEQVFTTMERGSLIGIFNSDGFWTVVPYRFRSSNTSPAAFSVTCKVVQGPLATSLDQNSQIGYFAAAEKTDGTLLQFTAKAVYRLSEDRYKIEWEVSNGGDRPDDTHCEIYWKDPREKEPKHQFKRWVVYNGLHLLRVRLKVFYRDNPNKLQASHTVIWQVYGCK